MQGNVSVDVLLATYNGSKFLGDQLDSLLSQSFQDFCIYIHDDGSTDETRKVIESYESRHPRKIIHIDDGVTFGSAKLNFAHLMTFSTAPYVMFCDQDDVWERNKISIMLEDIRKSEEKNPGLPILIHTDLEVVDCNLKTIAPSMFEHQRLPRTLSLSFLIVQNNITGCSLMINRMALECSLPVASNAVMHDWWVGCRVLIHGGLVKHLPSALVRYRQHGDNTLGAKKSNMAYFIKLAFLESNRRIAAIINQADSLGLNQSYCLVLIKKLLLIIVRLFPDLYSLLSLFTNFLGKQKI